jgi:hypothetical protein
MMSRRRFLTEGALAGIALPAMRAVTVVTGPSAGSMSVHRPCLVIYDNRFESSAKFARQAARLGSVTTAIDGDLFGVWRKDLQPHMRRTPALFGGLTTASSLFCFGQLARNYWMRVQFCAEHSSTDRGDVRHTVSGPANVLRRVDRLAEVGSRWPEIMANIVTSCPMQLEASVTRLIDMRRQRSAPIKERLVSWMIMPCTGHAGT